jgi:23S rRNA (cytidine1920-2'-O)/16S rRNA (cytidine1409-2'-O)-methyltransferase
MKKRLDQLLVERGLAETREKAQAMIMAGLVLVDDRPIFKAGTPTSDEAAIAIKPGASPYVSRGGLKLEGAIRAFGIHVEGATCIDVGSSTGGFTHYLLLNGARRVYAVDVDVKQLDWRLRQDDRVVTVERNARFLAPADIGEPVDLVTIDASFISLELLLPQVPELLKTNGQCVALVKPQFEVGRDRVGKGGIVKDAEDQREAVEKVVRSGVQAGMRFINSVESPITGREGNREFFVWFERQ